jgi:hypothetical protein
MLTELSNKLYSQKMNFPKYQSLKIELYREVKKQCGQNFPGFLTYDTRIGGLIENTMGLFFNGFFDLDEKAQENIKDTVQDEIADTIIRLLDFSHKFNIDLDFPKILRFL